MESWSSNLSFNRRSVDDEVSEVGEDLLSSILRSDELEEGRSIVDELSTASSVRCEIDERNGATHSSPSSTRDEDLVREYSEQEGNIGLDTCERNRQRRYLTAPTGTYLGYGTQRELAASFVERFRRWLLESYI